MMTRTGDQPPAFHRLHVPGDPFLLPCAWDVAGARLFAEAGSPAIGTTSLGVAAGLGAADEDGQTFVVMIELSRRLRAALSEHLLTCDIEDGYAGEPGAVVENLHLLDAEASTRGATLVVDGINIEDSSRGDLAPPHVLARKVSAIREEFPALFVNARVDTFWIGQDDLDDVLERVRIYVDAGADGIFVPGDLDLEAIEKIVERSEAPVNVLASSRFSRSQLAGAGVARISTGSLLYRAALAGATGVLGALEEDHPAPTDGIPSYGAIAGLS